LLSNAQYLPPEDDLVPTFLFSIQLHFLYYARRACLFIPAKAFIEEVLACCFIAGYDFLMPVSWHYWFYGGTLLFSSWRNLLCIFSLKGKIRDKCICEKESKSVACMEWMMKRLCFLVPFIWVLLLASEKAICTQLFYEQADICIS